MFPMTITVHTAVQLNAVLAAMRPDLDAKDPVAYAHPAPQEAAAAPAGKSAATTDAPAPSSRTAKAAAAPAAPAKTAAAPAPTAASAATDAQPSTAAAEAVSYDQVAKAITEGAKTNRAHVLATLERFGASKGPQLKPEQYADFLATLAENPAEVEA